MSGISQTIIPFQPEGKSYISKVSYTVVTVGETLSSALFFWLPSIYLVSERGTCFPKQYKMVNHMISNTGQITAVFLSTYILTYILAS